MPDVDYWIKKEYFYSMLFSDIIGHSEIINNLRNMVDANKVPHAMLFTEKAGCGALSLALATIQYLFCKNHSNGDACGKCHSCAMVSKLVHPDLHFIFPTNTSTIIGSDKKDDVELFYPMWRELVEKNPYFSESQLYRAFGIENKLGTIKAAVSNSIIRKLSLSSYEGGAKVMLIMFPERMNLDAANKILKSLEEPGEDTYFFLVSNNPIKIISTILSRCRIIEVPPIEKDVLAAGLKQKYNLSNEDAAFWANCSGASMGKAMELIEDKEDLKDNFVLFISLLEMALKKDLTALFDIWEKLAACGREQQKEFCIDASEILRKLYMISLNMNQIAYSSQNELLQLKDLSLKIKKEFYLKGYAYLNNAIDCIERNVNPKFVFCDLCNRIYYNI